MEKKTQFSVACATLSKMVKEKAAEQRTHQKQTLNLLPKIDSPTEENKSSPMTIFYGGNVFVFDDVAAYRAQKLMERAAATAVRDTAVSSDEFGLQRKDSFGQTRRASVSRFLCKRKERIIANAPYPQVKKIKPELAESWLGLGLEMSS